MNQKWTFKQLFRSSFIIYKTKFVNCHVQNISMNVHEIYTFYYMYENYFTIPMNNSVSVTFQSQHTFSKRKFNAQKMITNWGVWEQLTWTFLYTAVKKSTKVKKRYFELAMWRWRNKKIHFKFQFCHRCKDLANYVELCHCWPCVRDSNETRHLFMWNHQSLLHTAHFYMVSEGHHVCI